MSVASKEDVERLVVNFGDGVWATEGLACQHNAFVASVVMFRLEETWSELPRIWQVRGLGDDGLDVHVYLVYDGKVYNQGVTWPDDRYPNFSLEELEQRGEDVTGLIYARAVLAFDTGDDEGGFARLLERVPLNRSELGLRLVAAFLVLTGASMEDFEKMCEGLE